MEHWLKKQICLSLLVFATFFFCPVEADSSWLDKGSSFLKSIMGTGKADELTMDEISKGLKEALRVGSENVVKKLGAEDGFNADPDIHIPLPSALNKVKSLLAGIGKAQMLEDLELKMNRAAETATLKAKPLFIDAITRMTLEDAKKIYDGPDDAATRYFQDKMSLGLAWEMKPVIDDTLSSIGVIQSYDNIIKEYKTLPFVPDIKADLSEHVIEKAMDGIFHYLAKEEAAIRKDPVKRTTALLKKVFNK